MAQKKKLFSVEGVLSNNILVLCRKVYIFIDIKAHMVLAERGCFPIFSLATMQ